MAWQGADALAVTHNGRLSVNTPVRSFEEDAPKAFQEVAGRRVPVEVAFELDGPSSYGFRLGSYDSALPLVIDPTILVYAGFLGGSDGPDSGNGIAVDAAGNAYVTSVTESTATTFPETPGVFEAGNAGSGDAFVAKVKPSGSALVYASFLGGSGDESGDDIAVDGAGNAYVTGQTGSTATTFPETAGVFQAGNAGERDAFVAKVNPSGSALVYASFLGGSNAEYGYGIAVDGAGDAYVTGQTSSDEATFPETPGVFQAASGGLFDAFVAKISIPAIVTGCAGRTPTIVGTAGDDTITGTPGPDVIDGLGGDDTIRGGSGDDVVCGGAGADQIEGGLGNDTLLGGAGNDFLDGGVLGPDPAQSSVDDDNLLGGPGADILWSADFGRVDSNGGEGDDLLFGGPGNDLLEGASGNDTLEGRAGGDFLDGGVLKPDPDPGDTGEDTLSGGDGADILWSGDFGRMSAGGGRGDDRLFGGPGADNLEGGWANDTIEGRGGDDFLYGFTIPGISPELPPTPDNDVLRGGPGDDTLWSPAFGRVDANGGEGADKVHGLDGNDLLVGGDGPAQVFAGAGNDEIDILDWSKATTVPTVRRVQTPARPTQGTP